MGPGRSAGAAVMRRGSWATGASLDGLPVGDARVPHDDDGVEDRGGHQQRQYERSAPRAGCERSFTRSQLRRPGLIQGSLPCSVVLFHVALVGAGRSGHRCPLRTGQDPTSLSWPSHLPGDAASPPWVLGLGSELQCLVARRARPRTQPSTRFEAWRTVGEWAVLVTVLPVRPGTRRDVEWIPGERHSEPVENTSCERGFAIEQVFVFSPEYALLRQTFLWRSRVRKDLGWGPGASRASPVAPGPKHPSSARHPRIPRLRARISFNIRPTGRPAEEACPT